MSILKETVTFIYLAGLLITILIFEIILGFGGISAILFGGVVWSIVFYKSLLTKIAIVVKPNRVAIIEDFSKRQEDPRLTNLWADRAMSPTGLREVGPGLRSKKLTESPRATFFMWPHQFPLDLIVDDIRGAQYTVSLLITLQPIRGSMINLYQKSPAVSGTFMIGAISALTESCMRRSDGKQMLTYPDELARKIDEGRGGRNILHPKELEYGLGIVEIQVTKIEASPEFQEAIQAAAIVEENIPALKMLREELPGVRGQNLENILLLLQKKITGESINVSGLSGAGTALFQSGIIGRQAFGQKLGGQTI